MSSCLADAEASAHRPVVGADGPEDLAVLDVDGAAHEHVVDLTVWPRGGPGAPDDGAPESRQEPLHARTPEVAITGDDRRPFGRRERVREAAKLHRGPVRQARREVDADEVDGTAADVELDVQRAPQRDLVADRRPEAERGDPPRGKAGQDREADDALAVDGGVGPTLRDRRPGELEVVAVVAV